MNCEDLTSEEHDALVHMTKLRNRNTGIVSDGERLGGSPHYVALIECGLVERVDRGYRVLHPCSGHAISPGHLSSAKPKEYTSEGGCSAERSLSLSTNSYSSRKNVSIDTTTPLKHFRQRLQRYDWAMLGNGKQGDIALRRAFKAWMTDGATVEEICEMIDLFFVGLTRKVMTPWKLFISQRVVLRERQTAVARVRRAEERRSDTHRSEEAPQRNGPVVGGSALREKERHNRS